MIRATEEVDVEFYDERSSPTLGSIALECYAPPPYKKLMTNRVLPQVTSTTMKSNRCPPNLKKIDGGGLRGLNQ